MIFRPGPSIDVLRLEHSQKSVRHRWPPTSTARILSPLASEKACRRNVGAAEPLCLLSVKSQGIAR